MLDGGAALDTRVGRSAFLVELEHTLRRAGRLELRQRDAQQADPARAVELVEELPRGCEEDRADIRRVRDRVGAGSGLEVFEADLQRDGAGPELRAPQPCADTIDEPYELLVARGPAVQVDRVRLLGADRLRLALGDDGARIHVRRQGVQARTER